MREALQCGIDTLARECNSTSEVDLLYLKEEGPFLYSTSGETSWESTNVIVGILPEPTVNPNLSRRKIVYEFPRTAKMSN